MSAILETRYQSQQARKKKTNTICKQSERLTGFPCESSKAKLLRFFYANRRQQTLRKRRVAKKRRWVNELRVSLYIFRENLKQ